MLSAFTIQNSSCDDLGRLKYALRRGGLDSIFSQFGMHTCAARLMVAIMYNYVCHSVCLH